MIFRDINGNILNISKNEFENMNLYYKKLFNIYQKNNYYNIDISSINTHKETQLNTIVSKIQYTLSRK